MPTFEFDVPHSPDTALALLRGSAPGGVRPFDGAVGNDTFTLERRAESGKDWVMWTMHGRIEPRDRGARVHVDLRARQLNYVMPAFAFLVLVAIGVHAWFNPDPRPLTIPDWAFATCLAGMVVLLTLWTAWHDIGKSRETLRDALSGGLRY